MSRNKKPRKAYLPRPIIADTMALAKHYAAKPAYADRKEVLGVLSGAIQALRAGVATERQWSIAAGSVAVALAIEQRGIVRGLHEHLKAAEQALQSVHDRAWSTGTGHYTPVPLHFFEIDTLNTFFDLHTFQVHQLGRAEFLAAIDAAQKQTAAEGYTATMVHDLERMAA